MIKTAILTADLTHGHYPFEDHAALAYHLAQVLHTHGENVTVVDVQSSAPQTTSAPEWAAGLMVRPIPITPPDVPRFPRTPIFTASAQIVPVLREFDLLYALDPGGLTFDLDRLNRSTGVTRPVIVSVIDDPLVWSMLANGRSPASLDDLTALFIERTAVTGADYRVALNRFMPEWLERERGWRWSQPVRVLGVPIHPAPPTDPATVTAQPITQIVYLGRLNAHDGLDTFLNTLDILYDHDRPAADQIERVIFLGTDDPAPARQRETLYRLAYGYRTKFWLDEDWSVSAARLAQIAAHTLVMVPTASGDPSYRSRLAAQVPGLRLLHLDPDNSSAFALANSVANQLHASPQGHGVPDFAADHRRWLDFHAEMIGVVESRRTQLIPALPTPSGIEIDVCVPYFNAPRFLPHLLQSLERQTFTAFRVIVIDDGSTDPEARAVFADMQARYAERGWVFGSQPNRYPGAARNHAARLGSADLIIFLDADDVASPALIERLWEAIQRTGDDVVTCQMIQFQSEAYPLDAMGRLTIQPNLLYAPVGNDLVSSLIDDVHGSTSMIIRRRVFTALGGFHEALAVGYDDYELLVRCGLVGYTLSALPDTPHNYRAVEGSHSRVTTPFHNIARVTREYDAYFDRIGLYGLSHTLKALEVAATPIPHELKYAEWQRDAAWHTRFNPPHRRHPKPLQLLFLMPYYPLPATSGGLIRMWEALQYFGRTHTVTLVTFAPYPIPKHVFKALQPFAKFVYLTVFDPNNRLPGSERLPTRISDRVTTDMRDILRTLPTDHYDAAFFEQIFMSGYHPFVQSRCCVLNEQNIESEIMEQIGVQAGGEVAQQAAMLRAYETRVWGSYDLVTAVSDHDQAMIVERSGRTRAATPVIENGTSFIHERMRARPDSKTLLFVGTMSYPPNIDGILYFVDEILPLIQQRDRDIRLIIAGSSPTPAILALSQRRGIQVIDSPKTIPPIAAQTSVSVVPLRLGGGTRLKILDAMALGVPVVSTALGCMGLAVVDDEHLLIRDDPHAFADGVLQLLTDRARWTRLRANGRRLVESRYSWSALWGTLERRLVEDLG